MSKGNLFLGMGRGSVGDVTFYRANGQQLARARNRSPHNPNSDAQLVQRAVAASVVLAYKAGKVIFDHAFEGKEVPAGNQRRFLSVNMKALRSAVISQIETPAAEASAAVVSPSSTYPVPNAYRISEGSLIQNLFDVRLIDNGGVSGLQAVMKDADEGESIAQYAARLGLSAGDIYTIVGFGIAPVGSSADLVSPTSAFGFVRLIVKEGLGDVTTAMSAATYGDLFTIDSSGSTFPDIQLVTQGLNIDQVVTSLGARSGSLGVIRSNENSGLRSTSDMLVPIQLEGGLDNWGVAPINLLAAWSPDASGLQSPLILEGGGF